MHTASSIIVLVCSFFTSFSASYLISIKTLFFPNNTTITPYFNPEQIEVPVTMSVARAIVKAFKAVEKAEGAGARVRRSVGTPQLRNFSPFLMLDHFTIGEGAGFPDHPHRYALSPDP